MTDRTGKRDKRDARRRKRRPVHGKSTAGLIMNAIAKRLREANGG